MSPVSPGWLVEVWTAYAHRAATYQTRALLTLVYLFILGPARVFAGGKLMDLEPPPTTRSTWLQRPDQEKTLTALRRQF